MGRFTPRSTPAPPRIEGTGRPLYPVVRGLGIDDRAFCTKFTHKRLIARREIDVVIRVPAARAAHIFHVVRILEGERDAIHGQLCEIGIPSVLRVKFGGALEGIRLLAKFLAHRGRAGRQWTHPKDAGRDRPCRSPSVRRGYLECRGR